MKLNRKVWNNDFPQIKKAKLLGTTYDYGCVNGRGHFTSFKVSPGIELIFVDFDTSDSISYTDSAVCPDFLQLTYCRRGCCEYELPGGFIKTTSEGEVSILNNDNIPLWARFPLSVYQSANIQIDQKVVECGEDSLFKIFSLDTKKIRHQLNLTRSWYTRMTGGKIRQAFLSLFDAFEHGEPDYFRIKIIEILYLVSKITEEPLILHDSKPGTTDIINYIRSDMLDSLNSQLPISRIVKKYDISLKSSKNSKCNKSLVANL